MKEKWLFWASRLQSIAQAGLTYSMNSYDLERYEKIREITVEILSEYTNLGYETIKYLFTSETGYQTPKVDIIFVVISNTQISLGFKAKSTFTSLFE